MLQGPCKERDGYQCAPGLVPIDAVEQAYQGVKETAFVTPYHLTSREVQAVYLRMEYMHCIHLTEVRNDNKGRSQDEEHGNGFVVLHPVAPYVVHNHLPRSAEQGYACPSELGFHVQDVW